MVILPGGVSVANHNDNHNGGIKMCSAVNPGFFRDTFRAGRNWTPVDCEAAAATIFVPNYNLACVTTTGIVFGSIGTVGGAAAGLPAPNCGW